MTHAPSIFTVKAPLALLSAAQELRRSSPARGVRIGRVSSLNLAAPQGAAFFRAGCPWPRS